jgi:hypothetical protein
MTTLRSKPMTSRHPRATLLAALSSLALLALIALPAASTARVPSSFFGMSAVKPTKADFEGMAGLGARSYRVELAWPAMQAKRNGPFNFNAVDERITRAASAGLEIVPILFGTPSFLTGDSSRIYGPSNRSERREWQDFVEAAMSRYRRDGDFWQENPQLDRRLGPKTMILWNEPNARSFWWPKAKPKEFGALLRKTRAALDRVDPGIRLVTGGMFGYPNHSNSVNAKKYLKKIYRQKGARKIIDGVSVHPYAGSIKGVKRQLRNARKVMDRAGDRRAQIVIGETGWASGGNDRSPLVKSKRCQKRQLKKAYGLFLNKRKKWNIATAYWFTYKDYRSDEFCLWCSKAGLVKRGGKLKPAGKAYKRLVRQKTR